MSQDAATWSSSPSRAGRSKYRPRRTTPAICETRVMSASGFASIRTRSATLPTSIETQLAVEACRGVQRCRLERFELRHSDVEQQERKLLVDRTARENAPYTMSIPARMRTSTAHILARSRRALACSAAYTGGDPPLPRRAAPASPPGGKADSSLRPSRGRSTASTGLQRSVLRPPQAREDHQRGDDLMPAVDRRVKTRCTPTGARSSSGG